MGIRKGWALCGAREKHCFISHAVSSHPLLELQTLRLSMRSSAHHQDLPLDSIQKKTTKKNFTSSLFSPPVCFLFFSCPHHYFTCHLSSIYHFSHFSWRWRQSFWRHLWSSCLLFCYSALPPDCLSVDITPDSAHANDMGEMRGGSIWIQCSLLPRLLLLTRRLLFPGLRRSGLSGWSTLRNPGHGVSLGKQRPGQQGFTRALIILRAISRGSPELYTLLELLCLIVQSLL